MPIFPQVVPQPQNCNSISNQGSLLLVGELDNCADEPTVFTMTPAAAAAGATSVTITANSLPSGTARYIRKGSILHFGTKTATVTEESVINGGGGSVTIQVEALSAALLVTDVASSWGLLRVLAPQSIPINNESSTTDVMDLTNGLQGSEVVTKLMLNPSIQVVNRLDDRAVNDLIYKASLVGGTIYTTFALSDTSHVFGRAIVSGFNKEFTQADVQKPSFNLLMQAPWFNYTTYAFESTANKTLINNARKLAGLSVLV